MLQFQILTTDPSSHARRGTLTLNHGEVQTPIFMPVGTYGTVKGVMPQSLHDMGAQIILGNTFHLWMRPGLDIVQSFGGLHAFEQWNKPMLTDSGGFQVWSLGDMRKITEEGVHFASPVNGDKLFMSPEVSMQIQTVLNSDIVMQLDECTPYETKGHLTTEREARQSMEMSRRWAVRSKAEFERLGNPNALFGIVQGGMFENLRQESLEALVEMDFPGYAVGGDCLAQSGQVVRVHTFEPAAAAIAGLHRHPQHGGPAFGEVQLIALDVPLPDTILGAAQCPGQSRLAVLQRMPLRRAVGVDREDHVEEDDLQQAVVKRMLLAVSQQSPQHFRQVEAVRPQIPFQIDANTLMHQPDQ